MMTLSGAADRAADAMQGTFLAPLCFRAMGAAIGRNCCLFYGAALEFDLVTIRDGASTGEGCDLTAHTVENMVVKFAPVTIGAGCAMHAGALVMPGGSMEAASTLLLGSMVLKGETVGAGEVWSGLPAGCIGDCDTERKAFYASLEPSAKPDARVQHLAQTLGVGLGAAQKLDDSARGGNVAAQCISANAARAAGPRRRAKPLPPPHRRPPHLRPRRIAAALGVENAEARALVQQWRTHDPVAVASIRAARLILLRDHAGLGAVADARDLSRAANAGAPPAPPARRRVGISAESDSRGPQVDET
ncbi:hypothetical protein M885DRAFT_297177 [Pelagophyceae sp. CCMP2097]|nr:hypothetical protein M885DRAFT_297177 [Pelagophyceae sp. CCMP2097]